MALEARAVFEWGMLPLTLPWLRGAPVGDGHPVIVLPGLMANDLSTWPLRRFLESKGFVVYPWEQGFNTGPKTGNIRGLIETMLRVYKKHKRKLSLVGWSLGGVMARVLAIHHAKHIRSVVTLGSPHGGDPKATRAWRLFELVSGMRVDDPRLHELLSQHPEVPITSVVSKNDGVVAWPLSMLPETKLSENLFVPASHFGMGVHPAVWWVICDRLSQAEGAWRPLDRTGWLKLFVERGARSLTR
jgi:pimeloyl-ACP methyl ester carboxylesterase